MEIMEKTRKEKTEWEMKNGKRCKKKAIIGTAVGIDSGVFR
jgi:hypothetical protein